MNRKSTRRMITASLIAALYVVLTLVSALLGISGGIIQLRISEMLTILPVCIPGAIPGLTIGCLIANLITGMGIYDIIFGTLATLIGAVGAYLLRKLPYKLKWLAALPTIAANSIIIPLMLAELYAAWHILPYIILTVSIGEFISSCILGSVLYYSLANSSAGRAIGVSKQVTKE